MEAFAGLILALGWTGAFVIMYVLMAKAIKMLVDSYREEEEEDEN
jgi:hypothetical protein